MDKVWIKGTPSSKVVENSDVHYFYWKVETGLTYWRVNIRGRAYRIPIAPLKMSDYEPVKKMGGEVRSRYHYHFQTVFRNPRVLNGRHIVRFVTPAHIPIVLSGPPERIRTSFKRSDLSFEETYSLPIGMYLLKSNSWQSARKTQLKDYQIVVADIPDEALFDHGKMPFTIEIG